MWMTVFFRSQRKSDPILKLQLELCLYPLLLTNIRGELNIIPFQTTFAFNWSVAKEAFAMMEGSKRVVNNAIFC